jgi:hypothetical protein
VRDVVVILDDTPGRLHRVTHALGHASINIEGMAAFTGQGRSILHMLFEDWERALLALAAAGIEAHAVHDAIVLNLPDRPDALARLIEPLSEAGINISLAYVAVGARSATRVVLRVDQPDRARVLLGLKDADPEP